MSNKEDPKVTVMIKPTINVYQYQTGDRIIEVDKTGQIINSKPIRSTTQNDSASESYCTNDMHGPIFIIKEWAFQCSQCGIRWNRKQGERDDCPVCHSWDNIIMRERKTCAKCPKNSYYETNAYQTFQVIAKQLEARTKVDLDNPVVQYVKGVIDTQKASWMNTKN